MLILLLALTIIITMAQNDNKHSKLLSILIFIVQLLPMIIRFLGSIGKGTPSPLDVDTPDTPTDTTDTHFPDPN